MKLYKIINLNDKEWKLNKEINTSGRNKKYWFRNNKEEVLFKFIKPNTREHVSEKIAYEIGELLNISVAKYDFATFNNNEGSISYNFKDKESNIEYFEIVKFIMDEYPNYDFNTMKNENNGKDYSFELCLEILENLNGENLIEDYIRMILFDALIGNSDRHHSNWGLYNKKDKYYFAPLYDHSPSLGFNLTDKKIKQFYKDKRYQNSVLSSNSKSLLKLNDRNIRRHFDIVKYLKNHYKDILMNFNYNLKRDLNDYNIEEIINNIPTKIIDEFYKSFIKDLIVKRRDRIIEVIDNE
jgi:hypothetical protein